MRSCEVKRILPYEVTENFSSHFNSKNSGFRKWNFCNLNLKGIRSAYRHPWFTSLTINACIKQFRLVFPFSDFPQNRQNPLRSWNLTRKIHISHSVERKERDFGEQRKLLFFTWFFSFSFFMNSQHRRCRRHSISPHSKVPWLSCRLMLKLFGLKGKQRKIEAISRVARVNVLIFLVSLFLTYLFIFPKKLIHSAQSSDIRPFDNFSTTPIQKYCLFDFLIFTVFLFFRFSSFGFCSRLGKKSVERVRLDFSLLCKSFKSSKEKFTKFQWTSELFRGLLTTMKALTGKHLIWFEKIFYYETFVPVHHY